MDRTFHPPSVKKLHYQFEGWLGDVLLESFPVFLITEEGQKVLTENGVTGVSYDTVEVTFSDQFRELYPDLMLPEFVWLKPEGIVGHDDIGSASNGRLVVSQHVLDMLQELGIAHALIEPFQ